MSIELSHALGILSFFISIIAIGIAIISDKRMKAIANLEYDEKLAIMASHSESLKTDKSLSCIERLKNDFNAVSNLRKYASNNKKEELINNHIIPILETVLNEGDIRGERAVVVVKIIEIAQKYDINTDKIKNIRQKLRYS